MEGGARAKAHSNMSPGSVRCSGASKDDLGLNSPRLGGCGVRYWGSSTPFLLAELRLTSAVQVSARVGTKQWLCCQVQAVVCWRHATFTSQVIRMMAWQTGG